MNVISLHDRRDDQWFRDVYLEHVDAIEAYFRRRLADGVADATAEVFTTAWRRRDDVPHPPIAWLYTVAHNVLRNTVRAKTRATAMRRRLAGRRHDSAEDHAGGVISRITYSGALAAMFSELNEGDAEILRLAHWEELAPAEIAEVTGEPAGTVRSRLHRARGRARKALEAAGYAHGVEGIA